MRSLLGSSLSFIWLFMAISLVQAQTYNKTVFDTDGEPLEAGVQYYIRPAITDSGGPFSNILINNTCPYYVGQENSDASEGTPVTFTPFAEGETLIRESRDFKIEFQAITFCIQSLAWKVGETDATTGRRLIVTGEDDSTYSLLNYFHIIGTEIDNVYTLNWCPAEPCPINCGRPRCGEAGPLIEDGNRLVALDGTVLPVQFQRVDI
ncbi:kunitz type trypsin inhibitor 104 [Ziziphus jujuba]|uniref:Kunitz type trypsin inhibitor 104 n=1 Tax=Ziziphus jujuba TaxID=326968 RepID=A0A6P3ZH28_ZIZJJ|nr:kunitz type trypsin inhibitor 104 [Ziziphus jujuba]